MKRGVKSSVKMDGFTIVETMIVLAVTGVLFVSIAATWFGRQHKTEFQTSAQEIRSRIQQVISDVQNGYFPNQNNFSCSGSAPNLVFSTASPKQQGTNYPCVFLGKVIQFHTQDGDPEPFTTFAIAADGTQTTLKDAEATAIAPAGGIDLPDNSVGGSLSNGLSLQAYKVGATKSVVGPSADIAVGFLSELGSLDGNGVYNSGPTQIDLYGLSEPGIPNSVDAAAERINIALHDTNIDNLQNVPVQLCFQSGSTNQFAVVSLGQSNSQLTADLSIKQGKCNTAAF